MNPTVYIVIANNGYSLLIDAHLNYWEGADIIQTAEVEHIEVDTIAPPIEAEYRHWVTAIARTGARALEDALMARVYAGTAKQPLQWEAASKNPRAVTRKNP